MYKVDIYRVIAEEHESTFDNKEITEKVLETFRSRKTVNSFDKKSNTDNTYAHLAFLYDINFKESIDILKDYL